MRLTAMRAVVAGAALSLCSTVGRAGEEALPATEVPAPVAASLAQAYPGWTWTSYAVDRAQSGGVFLAHGEPGAASPGADATSGAQSVDVALTAEGRLLKATEALKPGDGEVARLVEAVLRELPKRRVASITRTTVFTGSAPDVFGEVSVDDGRGISVLALRTFEVGAARTEWQRVECASASGAGEECWALVVIPPEYEVRVRRVPPASRGGLWRSGWTAPPEDVKSRPARPAPAQPAPVGSARLPDQAKPGETWCLATIPAVYETRERDRAFGVEEVVGADGKVRRVPLLEHVLEQVVVTAERHEWHRNDSCSVPMPFSVAPFPGVKPGDMRPPPAAPRAPAAPGKAPPGASCGTGKCE